MIWALLACSWTAEPAATPTPAPEPAPVATPKARAPKRKPASVRVVAFGDVHGDYQATLDVLRLTQLVDNNLHWAGGDTIAVQVGDQLDRGDGERKILDLFERLQTEAAEAGGAFHPLLGNHEIMNVRGDLRYVTDGGFEAFADVDPAALGEHVDRIEPSKRGRVAAFWPGGPYAKALSDHSVVLMVGDTVFVHGGVLPEHVTYGLDRINSETQAWLRGERREMPPVLDGEDAPVWSRHYSNGPDTDDCRMAREVLGQLGLQRMVVAHTVQKKGIRSACDERVWRVDTGMSEHYGGVIQALEIVDGTVKVLAPGK